MIEVTEAARTELATYFKDKDIAPVRVFLAPGGCAGPRLSLALDEKREGDAVTDLDGGLTFVINEALLGETGDVKVDVTYTGFTVESENEVGGGGGCGSGCSPSGCGSGGCCG